MKDYIRDDYHLIIMTSCSAVVIRTDKLGGPYLRRSCVGIIRQHLFASMDPR